MRNVIWPAALLLLFTLEAAAQRRNTMPDFPVGSFPPGVDTARLQQKLTALIHARPGAILYAQKTTGGNERLLAEVLDHFSSAPADSMVFVYSGGRSSEFNFEGLYYDYEEAEADFYPIQFGKPGFVNYDSLNYYDFSGSSHYETPGIRSYNSAGKVTRAVQSTDLILFTYDASGRLKTSLKGGYDVATNTLDSSYRDFYFYNAAGHLVKDSLETWNVTAKKWKPAFTYYHTVNAAGYPTQSAFIFYTGSPITKPVETAYTYNSLNQVTTRLFKEDNGTGLKSYYKDTIGYTGAMEQYRDSYRWDTSSNAWILEEQVRRRMNASGLPDSVWSQYRYIYSSGSWDTTIQKLAYDAQDNPVSCRIFSGSSTTGTYEYRWYYEPVINVNVKHLPARADLLAYPNPVSGILYLKGATEGHYSIQNMAGQILQSGTLNATGVPVGMLAPGIYSISLQDKNGVVRTTQFTRQ